MKDKNGELSYNYFEVESKLKVYSTSSSKGPDGAMVSSSVELSDYKEVNGIKYPHKRLVVAGDQEMDFTVTKIDVTTKIDKSEFDLE